MNERGVSMSMLDRWAEKGQQIDETLELLEHLENEGIIVWESTAQPRRIIAAYFGVDLNELDKERCAIIDSIRKK